MRLIGPKTRRARQGGGEAGLHPSSIHDNAYAIGAIDYTGDMPILLGPGGPSLGGFVCPVDIAQAELWKMGQLRPGDLVRFRWISELPARQMVLYKIVPIKAYLKQLCSVVHMGANPDRGRL